MVLTEFFVIVSSNPTIYPGDIGKLCELVWGLVRPMLAFLVGFSCTAEPKVHCSSSIKMQRVLGRLLQRQGSK